MVSKKPRIVIIGAGMAGLTAANKLYTSPNSSHLFDLSVVEGGTRIGGRINSSVFCGDRIEQGATWIHGIDGSPVFRIAQDTGSLSSSQPWECMDGLPQDPLTIAEGGHVLSPSFVDPISTLYETLMDFIQGKPVPDDMNGRSILQQVLKHCTNGDSRTLSVGAFLRSGLEAYSSLTKENGVEFNGVGSWTRESLQEAVFAVYESIQRTYTSAGDLCTLDYNAEREYVMFPGEEITIAKGYSSVIENLASVLPNGMVQFGKMVKKIEWQNEGQNGNYNTENRNGNGSGSGSVWPVKLHFCDGSVMFADHVIVTVSLGVLKHGIRQDSGLFSPPLPDSKTSAISRLGYGVVNKVFLELSGNDREEEEGKKFPFLQMVFHPKDSGHRHPKIPQWIRRTSFLSPIYSNSRVVLSWFTGEEALELESLSDEEIVNGFSNTVTNLLSSKAQCNGISDGGVSGRKFEFSKVLRTQWGTNPLFLGSYSYIAVGSSVDDMDALAEPLPPQGKNLDSSPPLQILFAGEATHRLHYSTTHGAYFSGLREANRLLKHYNCVGV